MVNMERVRVTKKSTITNDIINDTLQRYEYIQLSREEEKRIIKKAKLSFYHKVDSSKQKLYLDYFLESDPRFKRKYENIINEIKKKKSQYLLLNNLNDEQSAKIIKQINNEISNLERQREILLEYAINKSKEICNAFVANNQRLIVNIAHKYAGYASVEDLYMEGNLGIYNALEKYNVEKNTKFSTYAILWIRKKIFIYIKNKERIIRFPVYVEDKINVIRKAQLEFKKVFHREASLEELSNKTGITVEELEFYMKVYRQCASRISLNQKLNPDSTEEIEEYIEDENNQYEQVETELTAQELIKTINKIGLASRTLDIIKMHYGLNDGIPHSLQEIANKYNLSRDRIRQIECIGLRKVRKYLSTTDYCNNAKHIR